MTHYHQLDAIIAFSLIFFQKPAPSFAAKCTGGFAATCSSRFSESYSDYNLPFASCMASSCKDQGAGCRCSNVASGFGNGVLKCAGGSVHCSYFDEERVCMKNGCDWVVDNEEENGNTATTPRPTPAPTTPRIVAESALPNCKLPWKQIGADQIGEDPGNELGRSVALSSDGKIKAVGEPNWGTGYTGRVLMYVLKEATEWFETTSWEPLGGSNGAIYIDDAEDSNYGQVNAFGFSVALSSDGRTVVVGIPYSDGSTGCRGKGSVRVYSLSDDDSKWNPLGRKINGNWCDDHFGWSVASSSGGRTIAIGAPDGDGVPNADKGGYVRVYSFEDDEDGWVQKGADIKGQLYSERTGSSVDLSSGGRILAVGSDTTSGQNNIRVYYFEDEDEEEGANGIGTCISKGASCIDNEESCCEDLLCWSQGSTKICDTDLFAFADPPKGQWNRVGDDVEGENVSLSWNGRIMAVANPDVNGKSGWNNFRWDSGAVQVYYYRSESDVSGSGKSAGWAQLGKDIIGENEKDYAGSVFGGTPVAISADGMTLIMGAGNNVDKDSGGVKVGHARVFTYDLEDEDWRQVGMDIDGDNSLDRMGDAVAVSADGKVVAVGAWQHSDYDGNVPDFVRGSGYERVFAIQEECFDTQSPVSSPVSSTSTELPSSTTLSSKSPSASTLPTETPTYSPTAMPQNAVASDSSDANNTSESMLFHWAASIGSVFSFVFFLIL